MEQEWSDSLADGLGSMNSVMQGTWDIFGENIQNFLDDGAFDALVYALSVLVILVGIWYGLRMILKAMRLGSK